MIKVYGLFTVGLKDEVYYWEVVVTNAKKVLFILTASVITGVKEQERALLGALLIFGINMYLHHVHPYQSDRLNQVDSISAVA